MGFEGKKKKIAVAGFSSILLVAMVVAVTVSISKNGSAPASDGSQSNGGGEISTSTKAIDSICAPTDYKETCKNSLSSAKNTSDPRELIKVAFNVAEENIAQVINNSSLLKEAEKDPMTSKALETCKELLETSIEDLKRSFATVDNFDVTKMDVYVEDLKTWLSGSITYQETCIDGFENTTGDTGEKMKKLLKTAAELSSNGLAMVTDISQILGNLQLGGFSRRLLSRDTQEIPSFVDAARRKLLAASPASLKPNAVVAQDGSGKFKTINEALATVPEKNNQTFVIFVKAGIYKETVIIPKKMNKIVLIGEGPTKTRISGRKNYVDGTMTFHTATVAVNGEEFTARDIGFENTAGANKHQAVALRVSADKGIFHNCAIDGYQDTLYVHTYRQFFRDCTISGTIDFIFGDAAVVFQNCKMIVRKPDINQNCMVTAQGRKDKRGVGGIVLQNCQIVGDPALLAVNPKDQTIQVYLGRPWKEYSRTIIMQSYIDALIDPEGWSPWAGTYGLDTCYYGEYQNRGPGSNMANRATWKGIKKITPQIAESFTPARYLGGDLWIKPTGIPYVSGMMKV
ncbi:pectinesterase [Olea europaea var. sylvestris]|uniref:Pectinesterase n=1 Tax=Olea europaea subsp. europaea TaxID=158383 RepID=A0A8S0UPT2_OLEEU|nr:pectinesterase [Olea europaea var. sylvestris]CAA3022117.1 pectinesterase-like [Olea europaea subsp. europaea]